MHELSLLNNLMLKIEALAREHGCSEISEVKVWIGALAHISAEHFREHFEQAAKGSVAESARLCVEVSDDQQNEHAADILLLSVDIVDQD